MANFITLGSEGNELTVNADEIRAIHKYEYDTGYLQVEKRWFRQDKVIKDTRHKAMCISITFKDGTLVEHYDSNLESMELGHDTLLDFLSSLDTTP